MSRINVDDVESATGASAQVYAEVKKVVGGVRNLFVALGASAPNAEGMRGTGTLSKQEVETIKPAIALTVFSNTFNRIYDTGLDFPPLR